jgi:hypothetical protein
MTSLISARRAAEDFARVVDGSQQDVADRYADLTATVDLLRRQEDPAARPEFVADLRAQLMTAADTLLVPVDERPTSRETGTVVPLRRHQRRLAAAAAAFVVVGGTAGVAAAAEGSLPGDPLYPIKRGIESAQVSLNTSDVARGQDLIAQANTRLAEIEGLVGQGDRTTQISDTLGSFQRSLASGADLLFVAYQRDPGSSDLGRLRDTFSQQHERLTQLADQAPATTQPDFRSATDLLAGLEQQARVLCANCGGAGGLTFSSSPALEQLINQPADAAAAQRQDELTRSLADKATQIASQTPKSSTPTGSVATAGTGQVLPPGVNVSTAPSSSGSLSGTVSSTTEAVTGLVDSVGSATGITPLTDTVTGTLTGTVDTVTGTVDSVTGLLDGQ